MCGLVIVFHLDGRPVESTLVEAMTRRLVHRGPDDQGLWIDGPIGFGHRRLAVFDTSSKGHQPMSSHDGRWQIVFNGAIYGHTEIRKQLEQCGVAFKGASDTEVLINLLAQEGPASFECLNGMFAVAAWDRKMQTLHLWRDRHGIKPLYTWSDGKTFIAASEIKAMLAHPALSAKLNPDALIEYFTFQNQFRPHTLFKGVSLLPAASHQIINKDGARPPRIWWDYNFSQTDETISFEDAVVETRRLMIRAVERQLEADVPVGCYLSGGMDSGSIASIACRSMSRLTTFTGGFDMSDVTGFEMNFDERRQAEVTAAALRTEHYERVFSSADLGWCLPRLVSHLEDLRMGMSYPNYYMALLASKFVRVALSGTGGDEIFGGYPWRYYRAFRSLTADEFFNQYYDFWQRLVPVDRHTDFFQPTVLTQSSGEDMFDVFANIFRTNESLKYETPEDHIANSLYFEIKTFLQGLLIVQDRVSAAHGLEERVPFLDNDLVDFAMRVPVRHKLANLAEMKSMDENSYQKQRKRQALFGDGKNVLREAMRGLLPSEIVERKKQGFSAPDASWYRTGSASYVDETLLKGTRLYAEYIDPVYVSKILEEHNSGQANHRLLIWSLLCFEQWCVCFLAGSSSTRSS